MTRFRLSGISPRVVTVCTKLLRKFDAFNLPRVRSRRASSSDAITREPEMDCFVPTETLEPLRFQIKVAESSTATSTSIGTRWSHELYRGPNDLKVKIMYSRTRSESEAIAQAFLGEKILGFDLEWNQYARNDGRLQERVGLIQVACEDKIALFHIGLHPGTTPEAVMAPSLAKLIESSDITKSGVNIMGDFSRLRQVFGLKPRSAFELSHLHNLITFNYIDVSKCNRKIVRLEEHVKVHLKMPLAKGHIDLKVWNIPLSQDKIKYAAADAYAGYMLFHCMNAARKAMTPSPPPPIHADLYTEMVLRPQMQLKPFGAEGGMVTVFDFYHPHPTRSLVRKSQEEEDHEEEPQPKRSKPRAKIEKAPEPELVETDRSRQVFEQLRRHRSREASTNGCSAFIIAHNSVLREMSIRCPRSEEELLQIRGVGPNKVEKFGKDWISTILEATEDVRPMELPCSFQALSSSSSSSSHAITQPDMTTRSSMKSGGESAESEATVEITTQRSSDNHLVCSVSVNLS